MSSFVSPIGSAHSPAEPGTLPERFSGRDRYLDLLRALALVRVVAYHCFGWAWLTLLFPSMGVMFALAGSLMARSLSRPALSVVRGRLRRLLPPMWVFGILAVSVMFVQGWERQDGEGGSWWLRLLWWIVPVGAPPFPFEIGSPGGLLGPAWAEQAAGPLWYLRAYLWFVLLSPLMLKAFRRLPWTTLLAPLAACAVLTTGLVTIPGEAGHAITDFVMYGSCWMLGFAQYDGLLYRVPQYVAPSLATAVMGVGLWWASGHHGEVRWDLNDIPFAQAMWSFGFVWLLFQVSPAWKELPEKLERFDKPITLLNARAVTVYLWHEVALLATVPLIDLLWNVSVLEESASWVLDSDWLQFALVWPLILLLVIGFGWVEDLAAKRRPRLLPSSPKARSTRHRATA